MLRRRLVSGLFRTPRGAQSPGLARQFGNRVGFPSERVTPDRGLPSSAGRRFVGQQQQHAPRGGIISVLKSRSLHAISTEPQTPFPRFSQQRTASFHSASGFPQQPNTMSATTTTTAAEPITADSILRLFPDIDTSGAALEGHDEEQIRLMDEVCIVLDENDLPIGTASKKLCKCSCYATPETERGMETRGRVGEWVAANK